MELNYRQAGQGENVILLHGLFGSLENLGALARLLAEEFTVWSLDLPNHGRSPHVSEMNLPSLAAEVRAFMDRHGLARAHLVGHSLGGKVAMELALQNPERVDRLAVIDIAPAGYPPHHNQVFEGLLALRPEALSSRTDADRQLQHYVPEAPVRSFLLKNLERGGQGGFTWRINLPVLDRDYAHLVAANREDASFPGKVLFIKGGNSDYLQEKHRDAIASRFPQAALKVVPESGHWLHAEKPDLVARLLQRFLAVD